MKIKIVCIVLLNLLQYTKSSDDEINKLCKYLFIAFAAPGTIYAASIFTIRTGAYFYNYYINTEAHKKWLEERLKSLDNDPKLTQEEKERKKINIPKEIVALQKILDTRALKARLQEEEKLKKEQKKSTLSEKLHPESSNTNSFFFQKMIREVNPTEKIQNYDLSHVQKNYQWKIENAPTLPSISKQLRYNYKTSILTSLNTNTPQPFLTLSNRKETISPRMDPRLEPF